MKEGCINLDYNKFRIWVGRIFGILFLVFAQNNLNYYALLVMAVGISIRLWATGYIHKDKEVTTAGPYKLLRHPLYLGNFIEGLGFALFANVWQLTVLYIPVFLLVYYKKMRLEEQYLRKEFGNKYDTYQKTTPMFIPDLTKLFQKDAVSFNWHNVSQNREHLNALGVVIVLAVFTLYQSNIGLLKDTVLLAFQ